jgi:hypothetical protein
VPPVFPEPLYAGLLQAEEPSGTLKLPTANEGVGILFGC